ncbi:MAG: histidinol-phosphate transaminase [bacterium]
MTSYIRKEVLELKGYHLTSHPEAVKLNQNEISWDIPGEIKAQVLEKLVLIPWNRYPFHQPFRLREKLSKILAWPEEGILISNGSNVLIQAILIATAINGRLLTVDPTFSLYEIEAKALGCEVEAVPLGENFSFPREEILSALAARPPSIIFLANPNAPTGNLFPKEAVLEIVKAAPCLVIVDEAYFQFADSHLQEELSQHKNLILLRTFSKAFGMGGVRIGFAMGAPEIMREIAKVMLPYCVSALNEAVAEAILEHPEVVEKRLTEVKIERAKLFQNLSALEGVKAYPSQTNFLIFQVADADQVFQGLLKEGVLVRNVSHPPSLPHTLRVTVGTPEENERFLKALQKVVR